MLNSHNLVEKTLAHTPFEPPTEPVLQEMNLVFINEDLDCWIRCLHLSTLPKGHRAPLTTTQFLNGQILTDIALAQELIRDYEVISNSPEWLFRLVVERLFKWESVESRSKIITLLLAGDAKVLERTLGALRGLQQTKHFFKSLDTNAPGLIYQRFSDGEEKFSQASLCSGESDDERLSSLCPSFNKSLSLASSGNCSVEQLLEEKCYELSLELTNTRSAAEHWKEQYVQLHERFEAVEESNESLERTLFRVRKDLTTQQESTMQEITLKHEHEIDELLTNMREVSKCAKQEAQSFQKELDRLTCLLSEEKQSIVKISKARHKVVRSNAKLQREKQELYLEVQRMREQLRKARKRFKLKLSRTSEENNRLKMLWELERIELLDSFHNMTEAKPSTVKSEDIVMVEDHVSNLHEDLEASLNECKKNRKIEDLSFKESERNRGIENPIHLSATSTVLLTSKILSYYRKWMRVRLGSALDFLPLLLLLFIKRVLQNKIRTQF